jgi:hypothetical protein
MNSCSIVVLLYNQLIAPLPPLHRANIIVVEDDHQLQKILSVKAQGCEVNAKAVKTLAKKLRTLNL